MFKRKVTPEKVIKQIQRMDYDQLLEFGQMFRDQYDYDRPVSRSDWAHFLHSVGNQLNASKQRAIDSEPRINHQF